MSPFPLAVLADVYTRQTVVLARLDFLFFFPSIATAMPAVVFVAQVLHVKLHYRVGRRLDDIFAAAGANLNAQTLVNSVAVEIAKGYVTLAAHAKGGDS